MRLACDAMRWAAASRCRESLQMRVYPNCINQGPTGIKSNEYRTPMTASTLGKTPTTRT